MMRWWRVVVVACAAGCGDDSLPLPFYDAWNGDGASDGAVPACETPTGAGTIHNANVNAPETWTEAASPHIVMADISINAALAIEECAVVQLVDDRGIVVRANGSLTATGREGRPVRFERNDPEASWTSLAATGGGMLSLTHTIVEGGGDPLNATTAGMLDIAGATPMPAPILHVDHVVLRGSESNGIKMHDGGGFSETSRVLTVQESVGAPLNIWPNAAGSIPPGRYTGNGLDRIVLSGDGVGAVRVSQTWRPHGLPYRSEGNVRVATLVPGTIATLTIEPGVTIEVAENSLFEVEPSTGAGTASGRLIAIGEPELPIVFTSAVSQPAAGDWFGLVFGQRPDSQLSHVRVEYAGRTSTGSQPDSCVPTAGVGAGVATTAAIRIYGAPTTATPFITNTTIVASARHGIDRGWRDDNPPDYTPTNTFIDVPGCTQTLNRAANGACPMTVTCP